MEILSETALRIARNGCQTGLEFSRPFLGRLVSPFLPPWEIGLADSHAIFSSLLSLEALSRFSQAPSSLEILRSPFSFRPSSLYLPLPLSFSWE